MGQSISSEGKKIIDAVGREDAEAVRRIASARPEAVLQKTWWKRKTPLMIACEKGNVLIASTILWASEQALGPRYLSYVNDASSSGSTALVLACKYGHAALVRVLLEEGASPLAVNRRGLTAAHVAAHFGHIPCLELVLDAPVQALGGGAPVAAQAPVLDQAGETRFIDAHDRGGFSPLHLAAISRASTAVAALVQRGAALDTPVLRGLERLPFLAGGSTPLHIAAAQGDVRTCTALLDGQRRHPGLELRRVRNMLGLTPLNCALLSGHHDVVRLLVDSSRRSGASASGSSISQFARIPSSHRGLSATFPESLRSHMMAVLQRASLLLQLRQIAGGWRAAGAEQPSDAAVCSLPGLDSLSLPQIKRLQRLLRRQETSLREVLFRLESALHRGRGRQRGTGAAGDLDSDSEGSDDGTPSTEAGDANNSADAAINNAAGVGWTMLSQAGSGRRGRRRQSSLAAEERRRSASASVRNPETGSKADSCSSAAAENNNAAPRAAHADTAAAASLPPPDEDCMICMDHAVEVGFAPCRHSLCFQCACRLCVRGSEVTTCPFCRREVEEVEALAGARGALPLKQTAAAAHVGGHEMQTAAG